MISDVNILMRELNHQIKLSKGTIKHKRNPCLNGYEQFNRDFETNGYQITPDHNNLNKRMLSGKGTGTKPKSSGRKSRPIGSIPDVNRGASCKCRVEIRFTDDDMDAAPDKSQVKQECK